MENSISNMRPELVKEWSEKNYPLTPDCVPFGSNSCIGGVVLAVTNGRRVQRLAPMARDVRYALMQELFPE